MHIYAHFSSKLGCPFEKSCYHHFSVHPGITTDRSGELDLARHLEILFPGILDT